ncbi:MAG TPA: hypothetical protein DCZ62_06230, partial [Ruminococcus sp.]|nr:hypothetical protein [Ruminococcus sp.]
MEMNKAVFRSDDIAIVGISCRFSGGINTPEGFYDALLNKKCMIAPVPETRKELFGGGSVYCSKAGFLSEDISLFDNKCFGMTELEAERMDPSQKLMLMVSREAFEDAGCRVSALDGSRTGVYIGSCSEEYAPIMLELRRSGLVASNEDVTGTMQAFLSGKISYTFGLRGPSITMNTACSSSFAALHQAILGLKYGDCKMALVGGVNIMLLQDQMDDLAMLNILSKTCTVRTFDQKADGTVRGEGAAAIVLKRLEDAEKDGDLIYAVISASGLDQDGRSSSITAPFGEAQEELIRNVWERAGIRAEDVDYIETHGTGTKLGDAIEISALSDVVSSGGREGRIYVGSVKPNIGHTEAVSGIASIIKAVMSMKHKTILPQINFDEPSDQIDWETSHLAVTTEPIAWKKEEGVPRIAAVSSFGLSGTNGHVVLKEYIGQRDEAEGESSQEAFIKVSAASETGLKNQISQLKAMFSQLADGELFDLAANQDLIRSNLPYRTYIKAADASGAASAAEDLMMMKYKPTAKNRRIAVLFTGQGSQYPGMLREIYENNGEFRAAFDRCDKVYREVKGEGLAEICFSGDERVNDTEYSQPAIFAAEVALYQYFRSVGVIPSVVIGHSIGEYAAACAAGVFTVEDGMRIVIKRGELMASTKTKGAMLAVRAGEEALSALAEKHGVYIACENSPSQTVLSGEKANLESTARELEEMGIRSTFLNVSNGFHSALMDQITEPFRKAFDGVELRRPSMKIISNVTGKTAGREIMSADYWVKHIRSEVRFCSGIRSIKAPENYLFFEIGSKPVLASLAGKCVDVPIDAVFMELGRGRDMSALKEAVFELYSNGADIDWEKLFENTSYRRMRLPGMAYDLRSISVLERYTGRASDSSQDEKAAELSKEEITAVLMKILGEKLEVDTTAMTPSTNLLTIGVSSILMLQLSSYIRMYFGVDMALNELVENCTVEQLSEYLCNAAGTKTADPAAGQVRAQKTDHLNEKFPLNTIQEAYFIGRRNEVLYGGTGCYGGYEFDIPGLDVERFEEAMVKTAMRHEMLRCLITEDAEQYITESCPVKLRVYRRSQITDLSRHLENIHDEVMTQVLPLGGPMWDMRVTEMDGGVFRIHFGIDFMIADARSLSNFWKDMELFYNGQEPDAPDMTYLDYLRYTEEHFDPQRKKRDEEYWQSRAQDFPEAPELPYVEQLPKNLYKRFVRRDGYISAQEYQSMIAKAGKHKLTAATVLLELFSEVIASRSSNKDLGIMLTTFRRENISLDINQIMGDFTSLMLTEVNISDSGFLSNAARLQSRIHSDYSHGTYSAIDFVKYKNSVTGKKHMYPVVFTSTIGVGSSAAANMFTSRLSSSASSTPQVFIDHQVYEEADGGLKLSWDSVDSAFPEGFIDDMFQVYVELVRKFCNSDIESFEFDEIRSKRDIEEQDKANSTTRFIEEQDLLEHFEEVCRKYPDKPAVICGEGSMTFSQIHEFAQKAADLLRSKGIGRGSLVTVDMEKSCEQIGAIAGIVYAGAVYVPMSPGQPHARTVSIMEEAGSSIILRMEAHEDFAEFTQVTAGEISAWEGLGEKAQVSGGDSAYIIYTSGSTGKPKGVECTHAAAMNTIMDVIWRNDITSDDVFFGVSSVSFDLSVFDIFASLNTGGTLVLPQEKDRIDPAVWQLCAEKYGVTIWNS